MMLNTAPGQELPTTFLILTLIWQNDSALVVFLADSVIGLGRGVLVWCGVVSGYGVVSSLADIPNEGEHIASFTSSNTFCVAGAVIRLTACADNLFK